METFSEYVPVRLTPSQLAKLDRLAVSIRRSRADAVRELIECGQVVQTPQIVAEVSGNIPVAKRGRKKQSQE